MRTLLLLFALTLSCLAQPLSPNDPAFLQSTSSLRRGLAGYWRLEEASGTRYDCSSTGAHLTDNNSVASMNGVVGNCGTFVAASHQFLSLGNTNILQFQITSPITIACWINVTNNSAVQEYITKFDANNIGYALYGDGTGIKLYFSELTHNWTRTGDALGGKGWINLVATYDGSQLSANMHLYTNSVLADAGTGNTGAITDIYNTAPFNIGAYNNNAALNANGAIDEVGIWNRVLTSTEIVRLYNSGRGTHFPWAYP